MRVTYDPEVGAIHIYLETDEYIFYLDLNPKGIIGTEIPNLVKKTPKPEILCQTATDSGG